MQDVAALILVGGKGKRLESLTETRSKPYVSFYGKYRIIDFALSSLSHSFISNVGLLCQYEPFDLMRYIGSGADWDLADFDSGISFLTPYVRTNDELVFQKGTANAVLSQIEYVRKLDAKYILILSGDQIYKINFEDVVQKHIESGAELTILTNKLDEDLSRYGIIEYDENHRIIGFEEKPENPKTNNVSMGIYLFNKDFLLDVLPKADTLVDFGNNLIPYILSTNHNVYAYPFEGQFFDVGTTKSLYEANFYFLDNPGTVSPSGDKMRIYSKPRDYSANIIKEGGSARRSAISDGCVIHGEVYHSILSYHVLVKKGAKIYESIVMPDSIIEEDVELKNAIVDENVTVMKGSKLIFDTPTVVSATMKEVKANE